MPTITESHGLHTVRVELGDRAYDVVTGSDLLPQAGSLIAGLSGLGQTCAVVTDSNVGRLHGEILLTSLSQAGFDPLLIEIAAGEASKSMELVTEICRKMLAARLNRKSFAVALGGGVVGDLAGFCAAILNRGIPFIQIPTTIVSQVDSSVGGKTGVNTPEGKNLLGAFHQPRLVLADVDTLKTLPEREYREGFAEVIKHAAIRDADMLDLIENQGTSRENLAPLIARNVAIKAAVVEEDEREVSGTRALLNFGHTIGHGVEAAAGYGQLLHGEAISIGIIAALRLSMELSGLSETDAVRVERLLDQFALPKDLSADFSTDQILSLLHRDKKFVDGQIRFVLLRALGDAFVSSDVTLDDIRREVDRLIVV